MITTSLALLVTLDLKLLVLVIDNPCPAQLCHSGRFYRRVTEPPYPVYEELPHLLLSPPQPE